MKKIIGMLKVVIVAASLSLVTVSCGETKEVAPKKEVVIKGSDIDVSWELKQNGYNGKGLALTAITMKNNSEGTLKNNWSLYFHQPRTFADSANQLTDKFSFDHVNGDFFKISPTDSFVGLPAGKSVEIEFLNNAWFLKTVDAPSGVFIVFKDSTGKEQAPEALAKVEVLPFPGTKKLQIDGGTFLELPTSERLFEQNASTEFVPADSLCPITPTPWFYEQKEGVLKLEGKLTVSGSEELTAEVNFLTEQFSQDFGVKLDQVSEGGQLSLSIDSNLSIAGNQEEAYTLIVAEDGIDIVGSTRAAVFYGIQSLRALAPIKAYEKGGFDLNFTEVKDAPRFAYRGMHLDVARNFQKKESVLTLIDMMAFYKLNKFHFHITDDEGWRVEIDGLPELTEIGSQRGYSSDESEMINPAYGSGFDPKSSAGSGFYSKEDFVEILKYAKARHIEVIPELDFPGHARAAIVSMKARQKRLLAEGKKKEANQYILHDPKDESVYRSIQLYNDNVVCVCQESTYAFLDKVVSEVVAMYETAGLKLENVHMGGDEVPHSKPGDKVENDVWKRSPLCMEYMAAHPEYKKPEELFYYFVDRFSAIMKEKGVSTGGWEEIGLKKVLNEDGESVVAANEKFLDRGFTTYVWNTVWTWGTEDRGYLLANAGYDVVLSNVNNLYFDLAYDKDPNDPGYYWGGFVDTKKAWSFIPLNFYAEKIRDRWMNVLPDSISKGKERLTEEGKKKVKGIQGQLWSETVKSADLMEYYVFPKMLGLVERAWAADPAWDQLKGAEKEAKIQSDWNTFASKVGYFELQRFMYVHDGLNNRIAPAGATIQDGKLVANTSYPGFEIRYTLDGSEPTSSSTLYSDAIAIDPGLEVRLKVFDAKGRSSKTTVLK